MKQINLFNINNYEIDTSKFSNLLHDEIVQEFECRFAEYVGAKYACSANSASSLLLLALHNLNTTIRVPSTIPAVVPNVVVNSNNHIEFYDDVGWVGNAYTLHKNIIDSAQEVAKNQYSNLKDPNVIMIFSFYPTKPVGSCDGGMMVSDSKNTIDWYRMMTLNGMNFSTNNWDRKQIAAGYKMNINSIQAYIANENLKKLDKKNERLDEIREIYNTNFMCANSSRHLYRIRVSDNREFVEEMKKVGIICGIHYNQCHTKPFYACHFNQTMGSLPLSEKESTATVSIPFHERLSQNDIDKVVINVRKLANI